MGEPLRLQVPVPRRGVRGFRWRAAAPRARGVSRDEQTDSCVQSNPGSDCESPAQLRGLRGGTERRFENCHCQADTPRETHDWISRRRRRWQTVCETAAPWTDPPALSVVIPAYDEAGRLHGTLEALGRWSQSWREGDVEIIVVDDGSSDGTGEIAEAWRGEGGRARTGYSCRAIEERARRWPAGWWPRLAACARSWTRTSRCPWRCWNRLWTACGVAPTS